MTIKKASFIILNAAGFLKEPPKLGFFVSLVFQVFLVILSIFSFYLSTKPIDLLPFILKLKTFYLFTNTFF